MRLSLRHIPSSSESKQVVMMISYVEEEQHVQQAMRTSRTERRKTSHKPRSKNLTTFIGVIIVMLVLQASQSEAADVQSTNQQQQPPAARQAHFAEPESDSNIQRVAVGRSIRFKCVVNDIGDHKLAWFHKDKRVLLAFDNKTVTWKDRIQVSSQANSVFFLQIDSVQLSDKGHFVCQLNTQPVQSQIHILDVVKSPQIREQETTVNIEPVKEFSPIELRCVADGIPKPVIKWRRESQMHELPSPEDEELEQGNDLDERAEDANDQASKTKTDDITLSASETNSSPQMASKSSHQTLDSNSEQASNDEVIASDEPERHQLVTDRDKDSSSRRRRGLRNVPASDDPLEPNGNEFISQDDGFRIVAKLDRRRRRSTSTPTTMDIYTPTSTSMATNSSQVKQFLAEGEVLRIDRVSRYDMGFYMCIASNGVPPSVSQRIFLPVSFTQRAKTTTGAKWAEAAIGQTGRSPGDDDSGTSKLAASEPRQLAPLARPADGVVSSSPARSPSLEADISRQQNQRQPPKTKQATDLSQNNGWRKRLNANKGNGGNNNGTTGAGGGGGGDGAGSTGRNNQHHRYRQLKAARSSSSSSSAASSASSSAVSSLTITRVFFGATGGGKGSHHDHLQQQQPTMTSSPASLMYFCASSINYYYNYIICNHQLLLLEVWLLLLLKAVGFEWA